MSSKRNDRAHLFLRLHNFLNVIASTKEAPVLNWNKNTIINNFWLLKYIKLKNIIFLLNNHIVYEYKNYE
jgi:hypothetical protein